MGTPWCAQLAKVAIPYSESVKPVQLIYPYYANPNFLRVQIAHWSTFPLELTANLSAIIVDDGSPEPAVDVLSSVARVPFPLRLFRIEQDVRWNWLAARNLGAHHAGAGWLFLTDMDHVLPVETGLSLVYGTHDPRIVYGFSRRESTGAELAPHPNSWFMTRDMYWRIGGYDEALSGYYGTDGDYRRRVAQTTSIQILYDILIRHEYEGDSSTTTYKRKQPEDARVRQIIATRGKAWRPRVLSFPAHEVAL
jgi:hypothetical protein